MVVGGGAVGAEYASIFAALGVRGDAWWTTAQRLLPVAGPRDLARALADEPPKRSGADAAVRSADGRRWTGTTTAWPCTSATRCSGPTMVLHAGGPVPGTWRTSGWTRRASWRTTAAGSGWTIATETTCPGIYAAGDVIGPPGLASVAMETGPGGDVPRVRHPVQGAPRRRGPHGDLHAPRDVDGGPHRGRGRPRRRLPARTSRSVSRTSQGNARAHDRRFSTEGLREAGVPGTSDKAAARRAHPGRRSHRADPRGAGGAAPVAAPSTSSSTRRSTSPPAPTRTSPRRTTASSDFAPRPV